MLEMEEGEEGGHGGGGVPTQEQKYMGEEVRQVISSSQSSFLSPKKSVSSFFLLIKDKSIFSL